MRLIPMRMPRLSIVFVFCLALMMNGRAQSVDSPHQTSEESDTVLSEPQIISTQISAPPVEKCKKNGHDTVTFYVSIDEHGRPADFYFESVTGPGIDDSLLDFARDAVRADTFAPAKRSGRPVSVRRTVSVDIDVCVEEVKGPGNKKVDRAKPRALPVQTILPSSATFQEKSGNATPAETPSSPSVKGGISAPVPLTTVEARYSDEGRKHHIEGKCLVTIVVDKYGFPENPRVVKTLGYGLDENAIEAVLRYRFRPALKNHSEPVPVVITVEVNFHFY